MLLPPFTRRHSLGHIECALDSVMFAVAADDSARASQEAPTPPVPHCPIAPPTARCVSSGWQKRAKVEAVEQTYLPAARRFPLNAHLSAGN